MQLDCSGPTSRAGWRQSGDGGEPALIRRHHDQLEQQRDLGREDSNSFKMIEPTRRDRQTPSHQTKANRQPQQEQIEATIQQQTATSCLAERLAGRPQQVLQPAGVQQQAESPSTPASRSRGSLGAKNIRSSRKTGHSSLWRSGGRLSRGPQQLLLAWSMCLALVIGCLVPSGVAGDTNDATTSNSRQQSGRLDTSSAQRIQTATAYGCPYPSVGPNCQVSVTAQAPAVALLNNDYVADEYATLKAETQATYKCDQGYELLGQETVTCLVSGRWSASPPTCVTNIAIGKPTNQSSTVKGGDSRNANDGNSQTQHDTKYCTETHVDQSPWWQIDLLQLYEIRSIRVLGRANGNSQLSLHDIEIRVGNSSSLQGNRLCAWYPNNLEGGTSKDFHCAHPIIGRFVSIQMVGIEGALSLCEVMVFSSQEFPPDRCGVQSTVGLSPGKDKSSSSVTTTTSATTTATTLSANDSNQVVVFNRTCYEYQITNGGSFLVADTYCRARGGSLLHSVNNLTQTFVAQELERFKTKLKSKLVWLGAKREISSPNSLGAITPGSTSALIGHDTHMHLGRSLSASLDDFSADSLFAVDGGLLTGGESSPIFSPSGISSRYQISSGAGGSTSRGSQTFGLPTPGVQPTNRSFVEPTHSQRSLIVSQPNQVASSFFQPPIPLATSPATSSVIIQNPPSQQTPSASSSHPSAAIFAGSHVHRSLRPPALASTPSPASSSSNWNQPGAVNKLQLSPQQTTSLSQAWRWVGDAQSETLLSPITSFLWAEDQPNNYNNQQDCMVLDGAKRWLWNDVTCELDYLPWICQFRPSTCGSPDRHENSTILEISSSGLSESPQETQFQFGKSITYACPVGHKLEGSRVRRCQYDGTWSGSAPRCNFINCGTMSSQSLENGRIVYLNQSQTTFGSQVKYICYEDYVLVGTDLRQCDGDSKWSGKRPYCAYKWCPPLQQIANGFLNVSSYTENSKATYQCNSGYKLIGNDTRQCLLGGKWTNQEPFCQYVECGQPKQIANGNYELVNKTTNYLSVASYACNENYTLVGNSNKMTCSHTNRWTGKEPQCSLIDCGQPQSIAGSSFSGSSFSVHSTVEYKCDLGFKEVGGSVIRTCGLDGQWSGQPLACKYVDCGRVPAIFKGEISYINGTTYLASQVSYECTPSNRLSGHRVRFCGPDGRWTGGSPKCEEVRCDAPDLPTNGSAIYIGNDRSFKEQSFSVGVTVQYACDYGHVVKGSWSSRLCQANGEWSGEAPICKFVDCGQAPSIENGNYQLKHPPTGSVGTALPVETTRRSDNPLSSPSGGSGGGTAGASGSFTYYGTIAHYSCDNNFKLTGPAQRECSESGQWRTPLPTCEPVQCPKPDYFDEYTQVSLVSRSSSAASEAAVQPSSADQSSAKAIRIIANNQWINHDLAGLAYGVGDKLHYSCVPGYELYGGPETRTCTQYGQWSGSSTPRCRLIDCSRPAPIGPEGRYFLLNETTTFNSIVEYSCVRPFRLVEVKVRQSGNLIETLNVAQAGVTPILTSLPVGVKVCANNGQWMPNDQQPKCVRPNSSSSGSDSAPGSSSNTNQNGQNDGTDNSLDSGGFRPVSGGPSNDRDANGGTGGNLDGKLNGGSTVPGGNDINLDPSGSSVHQHQNLNANQASTSLWAKVVIAIILMIMFGLIMLTLICIRSNKRTKQPPSPHHRSHIMVTPNGHPAGAMQIQLAAASSAIMGGGGGQLKQGHHHEGSIPVQQATALMQAANQNIYMNGAPKMFANGMGVVGGHLQQQLKQHHHMTQMHLNHYGDLSGGGLMMANVNNRSMVALGGDLVMNGKSSSLGIAGEQRHMGASTVEHPVSVSSASILDSYSRLSFESGDGLAQANGNKTIRNNPNGLVTFVSPSQQQQQNKHHNHHQGKQNGGAGGATTASQNQVSPQSISTSLSMSPSSSPSSSSSAHHTTATRLSTTDSSSSSSSTSSHVKINQQQQQLASSGGYQSPLTQFSSQQQGPQLSPPSLPTHPPPSHRVQQQHQQSSRQKPSNKPQQRQSQQIQQEAYSQQQGITTKSSNHHYMEPGM